MRRAIIALALAVAACSGRSAVDTAPDVTAIEAQMHARFDRPDKRLDAGSVLVSCDHAAADWTQGPMGGRALFERRECKWTLVLCSGDALKRPDYLKQARVSDADARAIVRALSAAEKAIAPDRLAKMRSFSGTVTADHMPS